MVYGRTREEAVSRVEALALRVLAERIEHGETSPVIEKVFSVVAALADGALLKLANYWLHCCGWVGPLNENSTDRTVLFHALAGPTSSLHFTIGKRSDRRCLLVLGSEPV